MADVYVSKGTMPTPHERELLDMLIEECAEVIQRATKMKRFGVDEVQPGQGLNNAARLALEVGDVKEVIARIEEYDDSLVEAGSTAIELLPHAYVLRGIQHKREQLARFMQTTPDSV